MGRYQPVRGNPETKQSYLLTDFSGGINTTSADEEMFDNEFRSLVNVDLSTAGTIKKRKGWGHQTLLNDLLEYYNANNGTESDITIPSNIFLFELISDQNNMFDMLTEYSSLALLHEKINKYTFKLLIGEKSRRATPPGTIVSFYSLSVTVDIGEDIFELSLNTLFTISFGLVKLEHSINTINTVEHQGKIYFLLDDNVYAGWYGLGIYDIDTDILKIITNEITYQDNIYKPIPVEAINIGLNALADDPVTWIDTEYTTSNSIRGTYLTEHVTNDILLNSIPENGKFRLNIITTGDLNEDDLSTIIEENLFRDETTTTPSNETVDYRIIEYSIGEWKEYPLTVLEDQIDLVPDGDESGYNYVIDTDDIYIYFNGEWVIRHINIGEEIITRPSIGDAYIDISSTSPKIYRFEVTALPKNYEGTDVYYFDVTDLDTNNLDELTVSINIGAETILEDNSYPTLADLKADYDWWSNGSIGSVFVLAVSATSYELYEKTASGTSKIYGLSNFTVFSKVSAFPADGTILSNSNTIYYYNGQIKYAISVSSVATKTIIPFESNTIGGETVLEPLWDSFGKTPPSDGEDTLFKITSAEVYLQYYYIEIVGSVLIYRTYLSTTYKYFSTKYIVANSYEALRPVSSLLDDNDYLARMGMVKVGNRLVLYAGNSMFWSDFDNFTYFPAPNFKIFDIASDDEITGIAYFRGSYLIFTKKTIWRMSGALFNAGDSAAVTDLAFTLINDAIGCIAPKSIRSFENTIVFLSNDGLYRVKQAYYQEGLENVEKIDSHIKGLIPYSTNAESVLFNEQYWLMFPDNDQFDTLRGYYTIQGRHGIPYVVDKYAIKPDMVSKLGRNIYSVKDGVFYVYNSGYYDFIPIPSYSDVDVEPTGEGVVGVGDTDYNNNGILDVEPTNLLSDIQESFYTMTVITANMAFNYPVHEKKMKSMYVKTKSEYGVPLYITVYMNNVVTQSASNYLPYVDDNGEITYITEFNSSMTLDDIYSLDPTERIGLFIVGDTTIGHFTDQLHKLNISGKAKNLTIRIDDGLTNEGSQELTIENIAFIFKLGKIRETKW